MIRMLYVSMMAVLLATTASAEPQAARTLPKDLPPFAPDKPLPVPEIARRTLSNGLTVWVIPRSGVPRVDYVLTVRGAGLAADDPAQPGFASTLAGLLTEGTASRDSKAIAETAQDCGGAVSASAGNDALWVNGHALPSKAETMLTLLADVARRPTFPQSEIELAKDNALQALQAAEAQPEFVAERALMPLVYGEHPYARTDATAASIAAIDRDRLQAAHAVRMRPDHALLVIAGRIEPQAAFALVERQFGDWKGSGEPVAASLPARKEAPPSHRLIARDGSVQSTILLGRPAIAAVHEDNIPLELTSTILGGSFTSRLMQNLREDKGYTYGAGLSMRTHAAGSALIASADVRNEVTGATLKEFFAEFARIGEQPVPADELEMNKRYVAGTYLVANQQQASLAGTLAGNWVTGLPPEFLGEYVPKIRAVSAEQVQAIGRRYFQPQQMSIVVVGAREVRDQLDAYGEFREEQPATP